MNSSHIDIERSANGNDFTGIATVTARGNSSTRSDYTYTDKNVANGVQYYRLKMVDMDAKFKYSKVIAIKRDAPVLDISRIAPNPVKDKVEIDLIAQNDGMSTLTINDMGGKLIRSFELKTNKGMNHIQLSGLSDLGSGVYMLQIRNNDGKVLSKLYKSY